MNCRPPQGGPVRLVYSEEAVADLVRLRAFIAAKDPLAAAPVAAELLTRSDNLRLFPAMGRPVELAPDAKAIRDAIFGNSVIRHAVYREAVIILRLWHHYEERSPST